MPESNLHDKNLSNSVSKSSAGSERQILLRLIKDTLINQFGKVEAMYEGNTASYEITTDTGLESGLVEENEPLSCTVNVSFSDKSGGIAEIRVECLDKKIASNVQECLRNLTKATAPLY